MAGRYAQQTTVPVERTRIEIEQTLSRYGADQFIIGIEQGRAMIGFRIEGRTVRLVLRLPDPESDQFTRWGGRAWSKRLPKDVARGKWEQARRVRWRALLLIVKAKLEAVESGISTIEQEFLAGVLLPDGRTVGEFMGPQIEAAYSNGKMPALLPETTH